MARDVQKRDSGRRHHSKCFTPEIHHALQNKAYHEYVHKQLCETEPASIIIYNRNLLQRGLKGLDYEAKGRVPRCDTRIRTFWDYLSHYQVTGWSSPIRYLR